MKLFITGPAGTRICDWESYALLRDNVQHYLEQGEPSCRFTALHRIEGAVDGGTKSVDASRLRGEVLRAWGALWQFRFDEAAISLRTRAILTGNAELPESRGTVAARLTGWELPLSADVNTPIPRAARHFIQTVLALTSASVDGDTLDVRCTKPADRAEGASPPEPKYSPPSSRARLSGALASVALLLASCGGVALERPRAVLDAPPSAPVTQAPTANGGPRPPPLLAPPPAYGNKVVHAAAVRPGVES